MFTEKRDPQAGGYHSVRPRRDFPSYTASARVQLVNSLFKEPVYQILEKIKSEPLFKWPNRMGGDASKRNSNLCYHYHQDRGHTMKDYRTLRNRLNQLAMAGKLNYFLHQLMEQVRHSGNEMHRNGAPRQALGTINVILVRPGGDVGASSRVMFMVGWL